MEDDLKKIMQPKIIKNKRVVAPLRVTLFYTINHWFSPIQKLDSWKNNWKSDWWLSICHWWNSKLFIIYTVNINLNMASNKKKHPLQWLLLFYIFPLQNINCSCIPVISKYLWQIWLTLSTIRYVYPLWWKFDKMNLSYWQ